MNILTVFTPSYNAAKTLPRTYKSLCSQTYKEFEWIVVDDGSTDNTKEMVEEWIRENILSIKYIYKENGGLHTGYNTAIANINTELCVCIDADDYMPDDAISKIVRIWEEKGSTDIAGIIGLDFKIHSNKPIGGWFKDIDAPYHFLEIESVLHHFGDTKMVLRTELLKPLIPMKSFRGEKNFNPIYLYFLIDSKLRYILINENLCFVDYQPSGMSANILSQFRNSPRSFAELRKVKLGHPLVSLKRKYIDAAHLVSSFLFAKDLSVLKNNPRKFLTILATPIGLALHLYIRFKTASK